MQVYVQVLMIFQPIMMTTAAMSAPITGVCNKDTLLPTLKHIEVSQFLIEYNHSTPHSTPTTHGTPVNVQHAYKIQ